MNRQKEESGKQDSPEEEQKSEKADLSPTQVAGAALASVTAAFLGSRLGVAGTVLGAGLTSVVITVGGALYQRSFENAKQKAVHAAAKASEKRSKRTSVERYVSKKDKKVEATRRIHLEPGMHWPGGEKVVDGERTVKVDADAATRMLREDGARQEATEAINAPPDPADRRKRRARWAMGVASCAVAFVLSMLVVTGVEGVTGKPLSGGDGGTTLGRVLHQDPRPTPKAPAETTAPKETESRQQEPTTEVKPTQQPTVQPTTANPTPAQESTQAPTTAQQPSQAPPSGGVEQPGQPVETGVLRPAPTE
jgi:hypothetical protein